MNYAVDTNLLVSATFSQTTPPALVIAAWRMRRFSWVTCSFQLDEIADTLVKPKLVARSTGGLPMMKMLIAKMWEECDLVPVTLPFPRVCRDPDDDFLFALFDQGHVDAIISGDKDVLALKGRYPVLTPRELIDRL